jgi:competence protein ComEA
MNILKRYGGFFLLVISIFLMIGTNVLFQSREDVPFTTSSTTNTSTNSSQAKPTSTSTSKKVYVEIKGEVRFPGVYYVVEGTRLFEVIQLAGGQKSTADSSSINLSIPVYDTMVVVIPSLVKVTTTSNVIPSTNSTTSSIIGATTSGVITVLLTGEVQIPGSYQVYKTTTVAQLIALAGGVTTRADMSKIDGSKTIGLVTSIHIPSLSGSGLPPLININSANLEELATLPGIGYIIGQRIIDYRSEHGPFDTIEEIKNVSGIKEAVYEKIKGFITV